MNYIYSYFTYMHTCIHTVFRRLVLLYAENEEKSNTEMSYLCIIYVHTYFTEVMENVQIKLSHNYQNRDITLLPVKYFCCAEICFR